MNLLDAIRLLGERPECWHGLNGPCRDCGPSLTRADTLRWKDEMQTLGVIPPKGDTT